MSQSPRPRSTLLRLLAHLGRARWLFIGAMLLMALDAACQTAVPLLFRHILNGIQDDAAAFLAAGWWPALVVGIGLTVVFIPAALVGHGWAAMSVARLVRNLRTTVYLHVQNLSADFFQARRVGEITARLNADMEVASQGLGVILGLAWSLVAILYALACMTWIDPLLAALVSVLFVLASVVTAWFLPRLRRMNRRVRDASGDAAALINEFLATNTLIKSFTHEAAAGDRVGRSAGAVCLAQERFAWYNHAFADGMQVAMKFVVPFVVLFVGAWLAAQGHLRLGDLVAFWGSWMLLAHALSLVASQLAAVFSGLAAADRVFEFLDHRPAVADRPGARDLGRVAGGIGFSHLTFAYPGSDDGPVLQDFDLTIAPGQTVALVGPSGAGKSTLLHLLLRLSDPQVGRVTIDDTDIRDVTQASLRRNIGIVFQENVFLSGTIADNLRLAAPDADDEAMRRALERANAWEFVSRLPHRLETVLGERGARLSGGQKQRLAIARVFLKNPPVLLLDEATAALDAGSEQAVVAALRELLGQRTALVVAHRLSTVRDADRIVVLDRGRVVADGSHEQLRSTCPLYDGFCRQQRVA